MLSSEIASLRWRRGVVIATAVLVALVLTLGAQGQNAAARQARPASSGGSITVLSPLMSASFDPAIIPSEGCCDAYEGSAVYDNLFRIAYSTGAFVPRLALSFTPNTRSSVWTMTLRKGVRFTDGTPFNAQAVKYNWERIIYTPALASQCYTALQNVASIKVTGPLTLVVRLKKPTGAFRQQLYGNGQTMSGQCMNIASPTALKKYGSTYGTSPATTVGAGPFILQQMTSNQVTLTRNPKFWDSPRPYMQTVVIQLSPSDTTAANALQSGSAQVAQLVTWDSAAGALEQAGYKPFIVPMNGSSGVAFNPTKPPLNNLNVREALTLAANIKGLNQEVSGGLAPATSSWFAPSSFLYDKAYAKATTQVSDNMAKAKQLIQAYEANHPGGVNLTITSPPQNVPLWTYLEQQWKQLPNVQVTIQTVTSADYPQLQHECDFQLATGPFAASDAAGFSAEFGPGGPQNYCHVSDPTLDRILAQAQPVTDKSQERLLLNEAAARVTSLYWFIGQYRPGLPTFASKNLTNIELHDPSEVDLTQLKFK